MNFWWVNQNQTSAHEIKGGYLWAPKFAKGGIRQPSYENMKGIEPGDLILAYSGKKIAHYGFATDRAISSPRPLEFGNSGLQWSDDGWYVAVKWNEIEPVERDYVGKSADRLFKGSENPFDVNGAVKQRYLFKITKEAADYVLERSRITDSSYLYESLSLEPTFFAAENFLDDVAEQKILQDSSLGATEKETIVSARRGQGTFRDNLALVEKRCRITGVEDKRLLVASHIKPWRSCADSQERVDGNNGLLLTPTMDRLFDRRYLSFENDGTALLSKKISNDVYERIGLSLNTEINVGKFKDEQVKYLEFHRDIFLG